MSILRALRQLIRAKDIDGERHEIREYILERADSLAPAFGTTAATIVAKLATIENDTVLAQRLLAAIKRRESETRQSRTLRKYADARVAADAVGAGAQVVGDQVRFDLQGLLSTALTRRGDVMVFLTDRFEVAVPMKLLIAIAKLKRRDMTSYLDASGLHIRWRTGGFNLCSHDYRDAERIVVRFRSVNEVAA